MASRSDRHVTRRRIADDRGVHINFITNAQLHESGQITVQTRGSKTPTVFASLGATPAAGQLTQGLLRRLHIAGGTWTSVETLRFNWHLARVFLKWLRKEHTIVDLNDEAFSPAVVWEGARVQLQQKAFYLGQVLPFFGGDEGSEQDEEGGQHVEEPCPLIDPHRVIDRRCRHEDESGPRPGWLTGSPCTSASDAVTMLPGRWWREASRNVTRPVWFQFHEPAPGPPGAG